MSPTERATNLIQRIERLFERATPPPWESFTPNGPEGLAVIRHRFQDEQGRRVTCFPASCDATTLPNSANASLIVTLRNVGLEGVVGPIRQNINLLVWLSMQSSISRIVQDSLELSVLEWCDRWEPVLDREEGRK